MGIQDNNLDEDHYPLVQEVTEIYQKISALHSLKPSKDVNTLFSQLVLTCIPPSPIDVSALPAPLQLMRSDLISLCSRAESLLETHFSLLLSSSFQFPLQHLTIFPYYSNYLNLALLEFNLLTKHSGNSQLPANVAFVGSGPLPLTSLVLASNHLPSAVFHNYDIDPSANEMASSLVSSHPDLSQRMVFHTGNILDVTGELGKFDVVFLAALVGMDKEEKVCVIAHLAEEMAPGAILMVRSAHGARAFLYPVVDTSCDLAGFEVLSVYHPMDEVINSVVVARKGEKPMMTMMMHNNSGVDHQQGIIGPLVLPSKCGSDHIQVFNNTLNQLSLIHEELVVDQLDHL